MRRGSNPTTATISFVVEESYFIIKNFKSGHFKLSSLVTMKFAGMGQWSTPLDL